jgi:predicted hotdog family 3-hydroxylacyl-ACP dehydratase
MEKGTDLLKYIPQRPPFVMVDTLYEAGENTIVSGLSISEENILVENGFFQESGLVENMAQTAALFAGKEAHTLEKEPVLGYIAAIKDLEIKLLPKTGEHIRTKIEIVNKVMDMEIAKAAVFGENNALLASCELRIFLKES